jgi:hypothetical protein
MTLKLHIRRRENLKSHLDSFSSSSPLRSCFVFEALGSNIGPETGHHEYGFSWFPPVLPEKFLDSTLNYVTIASFDNT